MGDEADYQIERMLYPRIPFRREPKKNFCKTCGEEIVWRQIDDKWSPRVPLGEKKRHYCKPGARKPVIE